MQTPMRGQASDPKQQGQQSGQQGQASGQKQTNQGPQGQNQGQSPQGQDNSGQGADKSGQKPGGGQAAPGDPKQAGGPTQAKQGPPATGAAGGPPGAGGPDAPPEIPQGNSEQLNEAYQFLQNYVVNEMQGVPTDLSQVQMPADPGSPMADLSSVLPKTSTGSLKKVPNFSPSIGSTPAPNLPTGQFPSPPQQLVGGLPASQVKMQQMRLPIGKKK